MKTITVWYNGMAMIVFESVANSLGVSNGHRIKDDAEYWKILNANASHGLSLCQHAQSTTDN